MANIDLSTLVPGLTIVTDDDTGVGNVNAPQLNQLNAFLLSRGLATVEASSDGSDTEIEPEMIE